jgi:acyl dehydratase
VTTPSWDELDIGATPEPRAYGPVSRTDIVRYVGATGDFNPIHHDEEFARRAGFPTVFSPGLYQAGVLAGFATDWLGPANVRRISVQFRTQVWPGDVLVCTGAVAARTESGGSRTVDIDLRATVESSGEPAVIATATFVVA